MRTMEVSFSLPEQFLYKLEAKSKEIGINQFVANAVVSAIEDSKDEDKWLWKYYDF